MSADARIRPARPDEALALTQLALRSKAHWGYDRAFMEACREELTLTPEAVGARAAIYVREVGERLVGFYALGELGPGWLELDPLFVEPDFIGKGHGAVLMRHALRIGAGLGAHSLEVHGDPNAAPFYRAMGAEDLGERESGSVPGRMLPLLVFRLGQR